MTRLLGKKTESFSAHVAWGALGGLLAAQLAGQSFVAIPVAAILGIAWEVLSERLSGGKWRPALLDVLPWALGGVLSALIEWVLP